MLGLYGLILLNGSRVIMYKQMDIILGKVYTVTKGYLRAKPVYHTWQVLKIDCVRISCDLLYRFWASCLLHKLQIKNIAEIL